MWNISTMRTNATVQESQSLRSRSLGFVDVRDPYASSPRSLLP